ncbi:MAG: hypothetical protein ACRDT8_21520, partial [Micromonosporaceae bacterium]
MGEFQGSGYREPPHLVSRGDGQLVRLPLLLYSVVRHLVDRDETTGGPQEREALLSAVATGVSRDTDIELAPEHISYLLDKKLAPLGVTTFSDGTAPNLIKPSPFLALKFKVAVIPEKATWAIAGMFLWLFHPFALFLVLTTALASEVWLLSSQDIAAALQLTLISPSSVLLVLLMAMMSAAFHEFGHATACRYGGVAPGPMGFGIYLVWPAFYTDITNSYRLNRAGRLRADLGGVYFNAIVVVILGMLYTWTEFPPFLVCILAVNLEIMQQLLPTLRFDGYYIVADLVGVPDLFRYIGPILKRTFLRRPADQRLSLLKRWPQIVVSTWVIVVIPGIAIQLAMFSTQVPVILQNIWISIQVLAIQATGGSGYPILGVITSALQILILLIPVAGLILLAWLALRGGFRMVR